MRKQLRMRSFSFPISKCAVALLCCAFSRELSPQAIRSKRRAAAAVLQDGPVVPCAHHAVLADCDRVVNPAIGIGARSLAHNQHIVILQTSGVPSRTSCGMRGSTSVCWPWQ